MQDFRREQCSRFVEQVVGYMLDPLALGLCLIGTSASGRLLV